MNRFPWWASVLLAILAYCGLKYGMVRLLTADHHLIGLCGLLAPLVAMAFLLLAGKQLYDGDNATPRGPKPDSSGNGKED